MLARWNAFMVTGLKGFKERQVDSNHLVWGTTSNQRTPQHPHLSHKLLDSWLRTVRVMCAQGQGTTVSHLTYSHESWSSVTSTVLQGKKGTQTLPSCRGLSWRGLLSTMYNSPLGTVRRDQLYPIHTLIQHFFEVSSFIFKTQARFAFSASNNHRLD